MSTNFESYHYNIFLTGPLFFLDVVVTSLGNWCPRFCWVEIPRRKFFL